MRKLRLLGTGVLAFGLFAFMACGGDTGEEDEEAPPDTVVIETEGDLEAAAEEVGEAIEETGEAIGEGAEEVGEAAAEGAKEIGDKAEDAADAVN